MPFRQVLSEIATGLGSQADDATLQRICDDRIHTKAEPFEQIEDQVVDMLKGLRKRGLRLGVVSNCFPEDIVAWPQCALVSLFDCAVFSCEVGVAKPDREIYLEATRRLGVDVSETWFIGDGMHDELSGAEMAGLRPLKALWFLRRWPHFRDEACSTASLARVEEVSSLVEQSLGPPG